MPVHVIEMFAQYYMMFLKLGSACSVHLVPHQAVRLSEPTMAS